MAAHVGNNYWTQRLVHGAPRKFESAEELWSQFAQYAEGRMACEMNRQPLPLTIASFCLELGVTQQTWQVWRKDRNDLSSVIARIDETIRDQKLSGAMVGAYNHNIVARDLGLADKSELTGKDGEPIAVSQVVLAAPDLPLPADDDDT